MKRKRKRPLGAHIEKTKLTPYGLGDEAAKESCSLKMPGDVRLCMTRRGKPSAQLRHADDACRFLRNTVNADRESFYALHLDTQNRVTGIEEVARGGLAEVGVHPREVFKSAILSSAAAIMVAHNHPSGNPSPSQQDMEVTRALIAAGKTLGIPVRDSIVVASEGCTSLRERMSGFEGAQLVKPKRRKRRR